MAVKKASLHPPFDPRIRSLAMPMQTNNKRIQRGYMAQQFPLPGYANNRSGKFVFQFLYNPSTIEATYSVQTGGAALSYIFPNAGDSGNLAVPINQTVNFTVMFDRTYELNDGTYKWDGTLTKGSTAVPAPGGITADPHVYGVWADVLQLQFFTGMMLQGGAKYAFGATDVTNGSVTQSFKANQGFMMMIPCWVFFGNQTNINYYGYISEWDVTYTHFSQFMVPMRCVIDISFNMLPPPPPTKGTQGGSAGFFPTLNGKNPDWLIQALSG